MYIRIREPTLAHFHISLVHLTQGKVRIFGLDLSDTSQREEALRSMGFCPQHDVLLDVLTVRRLRESSIIVTQCSFGANKSYKVR